MSNNATDIAFKILMEHTVNCFNQNYMSFINLDDLTTFLKHEQQVSIIKHAITTCNHVINNLDGFSFSGYEKGAIIQDIQLYKEVIKLLEIHLQWEGSLFEN